MAKSRMLVESLKRCYEAGKLTLEDVKAIKEKGTISEEEFQAITGVPYEPDD